MKAKEISSLQHPLVKHLVRLRENREYRYACKRLALSGSKLIQELSSQMRLKTLFLEKGSTSVVEADEIYFVTPQILKKITGLENPEPIAAEIEMPQNPDFKQVNFLLILDGISDPGNLGTLLRTARALGWDAAYLTTSSTDPYNEKAIRAAKGATFTLPWKSGSVEELHTLLQHKKMTLLAADAAGSDFSSSKTSSPLALALGNEAHGLSSELKQCAKLIGIPMMGRMESLNVATAGAILMHAFRGSQHEQR